eukprot:8932033-Pyramimonas_sp.AAC.1
MSMLSMRSLSSSAEVGSCMHNSLMTGRKASRRSGKSLMKALVWVMKSAAILGQAPHWVASRSSGSRPFTRERRKLLCILPMAVEQNAAVGFLLLHGLLALVEVRGVPALGGDRLSAPE